MQFEHGINQAWAIRLCLVAMIVALFFSAWILESDARASRRSAARSKL